MGNFAISSLMAIGIGAWVYSKAERSTGGNKQTAIIATVFCGLFVFFVVWLTLGTFFK